MPEATTPTPPAKPAPPKTNQHLRLWAGLCIVAGIGLAYAQAFGIATPDAWVVTTLLGSGMTGLGLVQGRNVLERRTTPPE